jgi:outer membrane protein insertion porin family
VLKRVAFGLALLLLPGLPQTEAQSKAVAKNSTKLTQLRVIGSERFQPEVVAAATGLKLGDDASDGPLKQAADRLAASGMFSDITYSYVSSPKGTRAEFHVVDADQLFPLFFDNFVWLSRTDLLKELQKREPLFVGKVPYAGEMFERLSEDLTGILASLQVSGTARVMPRVSPTSKEILGFTYSVQGVTIPVVRVEFPGSSADMTLVLQKAAVGSSLMQNNYSERAVIGVAGLDFLAQYHMRGYLKAACDDPTAELQDRTLNLVAVRLPVHEGLRYNLTAIQWSGNKAFSLDDLTKALKDEPGKPLNQVQLEEELGGISKVYGTRGYMEARLDPKYNCDDASQSVVVAIQANEGAQYHMGNVEFRGLSENAVASLRKLWKLHPGDPYDSSYPGLFLSGAARQFDFKGVHVQYSPSLHRDTKTVDVTFQFSR